MRARFKMCIKARELSTLAPISFAMVQVSLQTCCDRPGYREVNWENGHSYKGQWRENKMHGKGRLETPAGMYRGEFVNHKMHGTP